MASQSNETRSGFVDVEGSRIHYEVAGQGDPTVVLMHGGLWDSRLWDRQFDLLAQRHRVVRYDLRGYGRSDRASGPYSAGDDLVAVLGVMPTDRAVLVAHSLSGRIAIDFTIARPQFVAALVLVAPGLGGFEVEDEELERRYEEIESTAKAGDLDRAMELELAIWMPVPTDPQADRVAREIARENKHQLAIEGEFELRLDPPAEGRLAEIAVPTLVLVGDRDVPFMLEIAGRLEKDIPSARQVVLPGADHVPMVRQPERFNELVLSFLQEL
jgi:3-oxoadipate enol-lactonase